jgi:tetratricopeptide (TPR) repeat protein
MPQLNRTRNRFCCTFLVICFALCLATSFVNAQDSDDLDQMKVKVAQLVKELKYTEALPLLEKLVKLEPDNAELHFYHGFALIAQANATAAADERKAYRVRAREEFIQAKKLGEKDPVVDALIQSTPPDGNDGPAFSTNIRANALMLEAEAFFAQGKLDDALKNYKESLEIDPKLYHAALFSGDVYTQKEDFENAEKWYEKAIEINPNIETAYRYSATPLMKMKKIEQARDRYFEAFITEPYNKFALSGLLNWAKATDTPLSHPAIDIPTTVTIGEDGKVKINMDAGALTGTSDGSSSWVIYGITRSAWYTGKFAKQYPGQKYRHSLAEEVDAIRSVIALATADKKVTALNPSIAKLKQLNDDGLLEAYILLARADEGIAVDHPPYLRDHRAQLRRYMMEYVLPRGTGGNPPKSVAKATEGLRLTSFALRMTTNSHA